MVGLHWFRGYTAVVAFSSHMYVYIKYGLHGCVVCEFGTLYTDIIAIYIRICIYNVDYTNGNFNDSP